MKTKTYVRVRCIRDLHAYVPRKTGEVWDESEFIAHILAHKCVPPYVEIISDPSVGLTSGKPAERERGGRAVQGGLF